MPPSSPASRQAFARLEHRWLPVSPQVSTAPSSLSGWATRASPEHADLALKEEALARTAPMDAAPGRYRPSDTIMAFLDSL